LSKKLLYASWGSGEIWERSCARMQLGIASGLPLPLVVRLEPLPGRGTCVVVRGWAGTLAEGEVPPQAHASNPKPTIRADDAAPGCHGTAADNCVLLIGPFYSQ